MRLHGAQIVQRVALEYSVDPRLLLALIEYQSHLLSNPTPSDAEKNYAARRGRLTPAGIDRKGLYLSA